jgi:hypothetical protein
MTAKTTQILISAVTIIASDTGRNEGIDKRGFGSG